MKRTIIGSVLLLSGVITTLSLFVSAIFYTTSVTQWRGSKLWFVIFGAKDMDNLQSLSIGLPFVVGLVLFIIGLIIISIEYFNLEK